MNSPRVTVGSADLYASDCLDKRVQTIVTSGAGFNVIQWTPDIPVRLLAYEYWVRHGDAVGASSTAISANMTMPGQNARPWYDISWSTLAASGVESHHRYIPQDIVLPLGTQLSISTTLGASGYAAMHLYCQIYSPERPVQTEKSCTISDCIKGWF